jgi:hypothetical protein
MNILEYGHFSDDRAMFVFEPPVLVPHDDGVDVIRVLHFDGMVLEDGITVEDVIHAVLDPVKAAKEEES